MSPTENETVSYLDTHVIFHGVPPQDLALMVPFLHFEKFEKGTAIIEESSKGNALYVITEGSVEVVKMLPEDPGGKPRTAKLAELRQGDSFGEMELLDTMERSASVIAKERSPPRALLSS
jgi:CRP-like cAMP-binding protein